MPLVNRGHPQALQMLAFISRDGNAREN